VSTKPLVPRVSVFTSPGSWCRDTPPVRPRGCQWEMWGGAVAIDHGLVVYDVNTTNGDSSAVGYVSDLPAADRRALADYMIKLWEHFAEGK
jgi:hypothetical protein